MKKLIIATSLVAGLMAGCGGEESGAADRNACALLEDAIATSDEDSPRGERLREAATTGIDAENEEIRVAARVLDTALQGDDQDGVRQGTEAMSEACEQLRQ